MFDIFFNDVQVIAKDGRKLWAKRFEGIPLESCQLEESTLKQIQQLLTKDFKTVSEVDRVIIYLHDLQNWFYWNSGKKELEITI